MEKTKRLGPVGQPPLQPRPNVSLVSKAARVRASRKAAKSHSAPAEQPPTDPASNVTMLAKATHVGASIKRLRLAKKMSLATLAKAANVSIGMLSQIERNLSNPSLRVLTQIRTALDVPVSALFDETAVRATDPSFVRRREQHPRLDLGDYFTKELLTSGAPHNLQFMIVHIPPRGSSGAQPLSYPAEKGGLVLEGEFTLTVGNEEAVLKAGDSFVFDSSLPHGFVNKSSTDFARVLWIIGKYPLDRHL